MMRAIRTAATGMKAQEVRVDIIANNLANVNTAGFKKTQAQFQDLLYQTLRPAGVVEFEGQIVPTELQVGHGVKLSSTQKVFTQGTLHKTQNNLDLAVTGDGFFQILMPDGNSAYTRDGNFEISQDGILVTTEGLPLQPQITVPQNAMDISVGADGNVDVILPGQVQPQNVGRIEMARFINPAGLRNIGDNLFLETVASNTPILGNPAENEFGRIEQGYLELSNVSVVDELVDLITAQRVYELNSRGISIADSMMQVAGNIGR
ncbi:MAG: flagellar basal-body rod protein FlgG [Candidatus Glassbacteria bacterium]|nr:flagellar basal-body rod protein FlgG [Candidatus Glassbacteria bacterium]